MDESDQFRAQLTSAAMYGGALIAGVLLILVGRVSPVDASGYVSPFLVIFEKGRKS